VTALTETPPAAAPPPPEPPGPAPGSRLADRLATPMPRDRLLGWLAPLAVTVLAGVLRFHRLDRPGGIVFDEVYYTKDSWDLWRYGVERNAEGDGPGFVVHPPLGKWFIAVSQAMFGHVEGGTSFGDPELGWRAAAALAGTLAVLILARAVRRMFRSTLLGCFAGLLLALDGLAFVQSRFALLDIFLLLWVVAALACLVNDRDHGRGRLAARAPGKSRWGPRLGIRWWRLGSGICLGAACATKWSGAYTIVAFALLALLWDVGARRVAGVVRPVRATLRRDLPGLIAGFAAVPLLVYTASWAGWFASDDGWARHDYGDGPVAAVRGLLRYHQQILDFHSGLSSPHPFESEPFGWLVLARPVLFFYTSPKTGELGCTAAGGCSRAVLDLGNPAVWWAGTAALLGALALWVARRDWRAGTAVVGFTVGFLPWVLLSDRTMFVFYALPLLPFLILALTSMAALALGTPAASETRRIVGALAVGTYAMLVLILFSYFYPVLAGQVIPTGEWRGRMWFPGWI
jgi:dolichyl-phosphate-mannose-protein mannosyltransferase